MRRLAGFVGRQLADLVKSEIANVKHVVAVGSGKGGVGKSTLTTNLGISLSQLTADSGEPLRVGLLDADLYGPSLHKMAGCEEGICADGSTNMMIPNEAYGLEVLSIGNIIDDSAAVVWRGPMISSALKQLLFEVEWGRGDELDILLLDLPPGTGDIQITLSQFLDLSGAVVVSTPQDIALLDVRRAVNMFEEVKIPLLGLVENMSHFECPGCGEVSHIFGEGGARVAAEEMGLDFLGEVPLQMEIMQSGESGVPAALDELTSSHFDEIAKKIWGSLEKSS